MKKPFYRSYKSYGSRISYKQAPYGDDHAFKDTLWGEGYYHDNSGNFVTISSTVKHPRYPDQTNLIFVLKGQLYEVVHYRTFSQRGLMLACANFINKVYSELT